MNAGPPTQAPRRRWPKLTLRQTALMLAWLAVALLLLGVLLRGAIGERLWPAQRVQELRLQAQAALAAGRLSASDGSGARELYEAALALQPDQIEAREGLGRVAQAALAQARAHAQGGRIAHARVALRLAQELDAPRAALEDTQRRIAGIESGSARIETLLARAAAAHAAGRLDEGDDAALPLYQRVVQLQPRNQGALEGREDALEDLLAPAPAALAAGELARVADLIRRAERFDPGHAALPALRADLGRAIERRGHHVERLLARGELGAAAVACQALRSIELSADPSACAAAVSARLLVQARRDAADFRFEAARNGLHQARALDADPGDIAATEARLQQATREASRLPRAAASPRLRRQVDELLARAEQAGSRGHWLTPPGESAWDHLRQARALAPDDRRVAAALQAMLPTVRRCNAEALRDNALARAQACLEAWQQLAPADPAVAAARKRLGERWLAMGAERLAGGDVEGARAALLRARGLQPGLPGIADLARRLEQAGAGD